MNTFFSARFRAWLFIIVVIGVALRCVDYDRIPPFLETADEFLYPWVGMSWILTGVPTGWSWFPSYAQAELVTYWGAPFRLATPWMEKPPLYPLVSGLFMVLSGARTETDVQLSLLRLLPIGLSAVTMGLLGAWGRLLFGPGVGLLAALLYATTPTIVLANRLSLVESLLTPIIVLALYMVSRGVTRRSAWLLGILGGLAVATKASGLALPFFLSAWMLSRRQWRQAGIVVLMAAGFFLLQPLLGFYYQGPDFFQVMADFRHLIGEGLPELPQTLFRMSAITYRTSYFPDGVMLAGYIALFSWQFWLNPRRVDDERAGAGYWQVSGFGLVYAVVLGLLETGDSSSAPFYGWHLFPLFPVAMMALAKCMYDLWRAPHALGMLLFYLLLGHSSVRFLLVAWPSLQGNWQWILFTLLVALVAAAQARVVFQRRLLLLLLAIVVGIHLLVIFYLPLYYPSRAQPISPYVTWNFSCVGEVLG